MAEGHVWFGSDLSQGKGWTHAGLLTGKKVFSEFVICVKYVILKRTCLEMVAWASIFIYR